VEEEMATWETTTTVMGEPEDVLEVLTDPCAARRWSPIGFELEQIEGDRLRSGTHAVLSGKLAGRSVKFEVDVIKASDGQLELRATGPVEMDVSYDAVTLGEVTEVKASVAVRSAGGLLGRLLSSATDALLAGGALNLAVQSVAREVEQSVAYATAA
jgi:polyketide cyclase/dehydrase/lipid transport protein